MKRGNFDMLIVMWMCHVEGRPRHHIIHKLSKTESHDDVSQSWSRWPIIDQYSFYLFFLSHKIKRFFFFFLMCGAREMTQILDSRGEGGVGVWESTEPETLNTQFSTHCDSFFSLSLLSWFLSLKKMVRIEGWGREGGESKVVSSIGEEGYASSMACHCSVISSSPSSSASYGGGVLPSLAMQMRNVNIMKSNSSSPNFVMSSNSKRPNFALLCSFNRDSYTTVVSEVPTTTTTTNTNINIFLSHICVIFMAFWVDKLQIDWVLWDGLLCNLLGSLFIWWYYI